MSTKQYKIMITGGHLTPAVAVIEELRKRGYKNFVWVGQRYNQGGTKEVSPEYKTITELEIPFISLRSGKLIRKWTAQTFFYGIWNILKVFIGFFEAFFIVMTQRPKIIVSFGGFLAVPIAFWGRLFLYKVITHEQTIVTGLANKIIGFFADKILVSWDSSLTHFPKHKTILTGNPIRREIFHVRSDELTKDLDPELPTLFIYCGNQGSNEINKRFFKIIDMLIPDMNIIHQTGNSTVTNDFNKALEIKRNLPKKYEDRYLPIDYIMGRNLGEVYARADLMFTRGGANTALEILALGKLAIMMPIPWTSHDEQLKNAEFVANTGLGYVLHQKDTLTAETIYQTVLMGMNQYKSKKGFNGKPMERCQEEAKSLVLLDAPKLVADEIEQLIYTGR